MSSETAYALFIIAHVVLTACAEAGSSRNVDRTDSAGVAIVRNADPDRPLDWSVQEILRLGGKDEGPESFFRVNPRGLATDAGGRIYVLDATQVHVFDADGQHVRTMGGEGEGPGEMKSGSALFVVDDEVRIVDLQKRALVRFDLEGGVLPEIRLPGLLYATADPTPAARDGLIMAHDTAFDSALRPGSRLRRRIMLHAFAAPHAWQDPVELAALDWEQPATFNPVGSADCPMKVQRPPIFTREPVWRGDLDRVFHNGTDEYQVDVTDLTGRRTSIRRDLPVHAATRELAANDVGPMNFQFQGQSCVLTAEERAEQTGWVDRVPWVLDIMPTPADEILVLRRAPGEPVRARIDVFDADGEYSGTLPPDFPLPAAWRGAGEFLRIEHDDDGLPYIVVYRVRRSGD